MVSKISWRQVGFQFEKQHSRMVLKASFQRWQPNLMTPTEFVLQLDELLVVAATPESTSILKSRTHESVEKFPQAFLIKVFF